MQKKIKIFTLSDHPLSPSGVGTQTRYFIETLLKTGKFQFVCFGGAVKHNDYRPQKIDPWGEDWRIFPVDGYGTPEMVRSLMRTERPDIVWFMTDPRFWGWLWEIDDEIRQNAPMVYHHVWDNFPAPKFNKMFYESNDKIVTISKVTDDIVRTVAPDVDCTYLPHSVQGDVFTNEVTPEAAEEEQNFRLQMIKETSTEELYNEDKLIFFWNNRNARRKQSGTLIYWFKDFLDQIGHDKASLVMHTDPKDPNGQDLHHLIVNLGLNDGQVILSTQKVESPDLARIYRVADCTINISDAEGFGLATLESLSCGTPIIVTMTGGLQQQVTDGENWFGIGIEPASKSIIGSQAVPYIYEDRISQQDFLDAMNKMYSMTKEEREAMGAAGRQYVQENYNFDTLMQQWVDLMVELHETHGSWQTRKTYKSWQLLEVA